MAKAKTSIAKEVAKEPVKQTDGVKPNPQGTIDERMAALLEDHKRMGAR